MCLFVCACAITWLVDVLIECVVCVCKLIDNVITCGRLCVWVIVCEFALLCVSVCACVRDVCVCVLCRVRAIVCVVGWLGWVGLCCVGLGSLDLVWAVVVWCVCVRVWVFGCVLRGLWFGCVCAFVCGWRFVVLCVLCVLCGVLLCGHELCCCIVWSCCVCGLLLGCVVLRWCVD